MKPEQLAKAFNQNVETLDIQVRKFLESSDPSNTQAIRKATRRLATSYSVLPRKVRKDAPLRKYLEASRELSKAAGRVRDLDTISSWTSQVGDAKDRRSFSSDLVRLRESTLPGALKDAKELSKAKLPSVKVGRLDPSDLDRRLEKVERRVSKKVDKEFEEFVSTQEVDVMHALRKDSKRLRHLLELSQNGAPRSLLVRLKSIQDDLGAIRDHDLVIDYLRSRVRLTSTRALVREEIAKRHARLEDFFTKNRGQGRVVPAPAKS